MLPKSHYSHSRPDLKRWLCVFAIFLTVCINPFGADAHPSPNTLMFLDISPKEVNMELQIPLPELALAFAINPGSNPETIIRDDGPRLKEYLLAHIHAYRQKGQQWMVEIRNMKMDKGLYADSNIPYWEVNAGVVLTPGTGEDTRHFFLDYDVVMHQVINHAALVSIRSDWETGLVDSKETEVHATNWNLRDNIVPPLEVNLQKGSAWRGFSSMVELGIRHIGEGTDHLMFLLVLLLPAPLLVSGKRWKGFGGTKYSVVRLLKIVTAFTIGHSITLILGSLGWVRLPSQPVEIMIAFSILVSAIHALKPIFPGKEIFVAAGFGLIHGMAFASTLANLNLDAGAMALSILGFNLGIELMQLVVIAVTVPWLIILSSKPLYKYVRMIGALFAAAAAVAWMIQRFNNRANLFTQMVEQFATQARWIVLILALLATSTLFRNRISNGQTYN